MIWTPKNALNIVLVDVAGRPIPGVQSYNDETGEITAFLCTTEDSKTRCILSGESLEKSLEVVEIKFFVKGAKLVNRPS